MEIITTWNELIAYKGNDTCALISFDKKANINYLHLGHENIISYAQSLNLDHVMVQFFDFYNIAWALKNIMDKDVIPPSAGQVWDEPGMTQYLIDHNVDIMFIPVYNYIELLFQPLDISQEKLIIYGQKAATFGTIGDVGLDDISVTNAAGYYAIWRAGLVPSNMHYVRADNEPMSYLKGVYYEKYLNYTMHYVPQTFRPDGLPYSSQLIDGRVTQDHYDFIIAAKSIIDSDPLTDSTDQINSLDNTGNLRCAGYRIFDHQTYNWFPDDRIIVSVTLYNKLAEHGYNYDKVIYI